MAYTIAFFGTKPYDESSFTDKNKEFPRFSHCIILSKGNRVDKTIYNYESDIKKQLLLLSFK